MHRYRRHPHRLAKRAAWAGPSATRTALAGFTLLELLVSVAVLGVMASLAAPQFASPLAESRVRATTLEFVAGLGSARTEASRRGVPVTLCPRSSASNTCNSSATSWNQGWILYADIDASGNFDASDPLLSVRTALPVGSRIGEGQADRISVLPSGEHVFASGTARTILFESNGSRRYVVISRVGRAVVVTADACGSAIQCTP
jgi:type IV fimbrial biogenesis protein FimT